MLPWNPRWTTSVNTWTNKTECKLQKQHTRAGRDNIPCMWLVTFTKWVHQLVAWKAGHSVAASSNHSRLDSTNWGHIVLFYGAQYGDYGYSQTSDFQEALWKVIICPDRYPL